MKLFYFHHTKDFGHDFFIEFFRFRGWCLFHSYFYTAEYGRTFPYLSIVMGGSRFFYFALSFLKVGFNFELLSRSHFK